MTQQRRDGRRHIISEGAGRVRSERPPKREAGRERWLEILEKAASTQPDQLDDYWQWLLGELGLQMGHFLGVFDVLQQGRWRTAGDPRSYLAKAAKCESGREARSEAKRRLHEDIVDDVDVDDVDCWTVEERLETLLERSVAPAKSQIPEKGAKLAPRIRAEILRTVELTIEQQTWYDEVNAESGPDAIYHHPPNAKTIDSKQWGKKAGFDHWEQRALAYRVLGTSREAALKSQPDDSSRRALQAAWKRVDRNGMKRLAEAASSSLTKPVESQRSNIRRKGETAAPELCKESSTHGLLTVEQVSERWKAWGIPPDWIRVYAHAKELRPVEPSNRLLFHPEQCDAFVRERQRHNDPRFPRIVDRFTSELDPIPWWSTVRPTPSTAGKRILRKSVPDYVFPDTR